MKMVIMATLVVFFVFAAVACGGSVVRLVYDAVSLLASVAAFDRTDAGMLDWLPGSGESNLESLGAVNLTRYTHYEGGKQTASGYIMKNSDRDLVCAVGRDWWRKRVLPGDMVFIEGMPRPCVALDTMALYSSRGKPQTTWVDIYTGGDVRGALRFGLQKRKAWLLHRK